MTRKRFIKLLMARGWRKYEAQSLVNSLKYFTGFDYAELLQWYDKERQKEWENYCSGLTFRIALYDDTYNEPLPGQYIYVPELYGKMEGNQ